MRHATIILLLLAAACSSDDAGLNADVPVLDLAGQTDGVRRIFGSTSTGRFGVPVAGGFDCDGDGRQDYAMSAMRASPEGRAEAGQVFLIFGDGQISGAIDTGLQHDAVLSILGATVRENTGIEVWIDDVTGDGLGDVIIGRSNFSPPGRTGAGAVSIVVGDAALRTLAEAGTPLDLASPPAGVRIATFYGAEALDRLGFWNRTGDATGDGVADLLISADQSDRTGEPNAGSAYLIRGGTHLAQSQTIDLSNFGSTALAGNVARIDPPMNASDYHFGATLEIIDLDADDRGELLIAASLARVGGLLEAEGAPQGSGVRVGGNPGGSLFIYWSDNLPDTTPWPVGLTIGFDSPPGTVTQIDGGTVSGVFTSDRFGEELVGGVDYDDDGSLDLFVGDIRGDAPGLPDAGLGHVFFDASQLRGQSFSIQNVPSSVRVTHIIGPSASAISSDTSLQGDIDGDGIVDLVTASPLADPRGRREAGVIHILWGQAGPWPEVIDLADRPPIATFRTTDIYGARGATNAEDFGDTLMYSAVGADVDADGRTDLIVNEMRGNGEQRGTVDVGNLIVISGRVVPKPGP